MEIFRCSMHWQNRSTSVQSNFQMPAFTGFESTALVGEPSLKFARLHSSRIQHLCFLRRLAPTIDSHGAALGYEVDAPEVWVVDHVFGVVVGCVDGQVLDVLAEEEFSGFCAVVGFARLDFAGAVFEFYFPLVAGAVEFVGLGWG